MHDGELLRRYIQSGSNTAFGQLTSKYRSLVFSTCLREVHDYNIAEDVAQSVFLLLARKPPRLASNSTLAGWLFYSSRLLAKNTARKQRRQRTHEIQTGLEIARTAEPTPSLVSSLMNDVLANLNEPELETVLLRLIDGCSFSELGAKLGISEEAARKRFNRALKRLRGYFEMNGLSRTLGQTKGTIRTMLTDNEIVRAIDARYTGLDDIMASRDAEVARKYLANLYAPDFYAIGEKGERVEQSGNSDGFVNYILNRPEEIERKHEIELIESVAETATVAVKLNVCRSSASSFRARFEDTWRRIDGVWQLAVTRTLGREEYASAG